MRYVVCLLTALMVFPSCPSVPVADCSSETVALAAVPPALDVPMFHGSPLGNGRTRAVRFRGPGPLVRALSAGHATPLSLTTADTNRDGVMDLVAGFETDGGNAIVVFEGTPAREPESSSPRDAIAIACTARPDHIVAGDFDGDGDTDVATCAAGGYTVEVLSTDATARSAAPSQLEAGGPVSGLLSADVGLQSGRPDLIVAAGDGGDSRIDVHDSGLDWRHVSASYPVAGVVTALDAGYLGGAPERSIVASAGRTVSILGRDGSKTLAVPISAAHVCIRSASGVPFVVVSDGSGSLVDIAASGDTPVAGQPYAGVGGRIVSLGPSGLVETGAGRNAALWRGRTRTTATRSIGPAIAMLADGDALPDLVAFESGTALPTVFATQGTSPPILVTNADDRGPGSLRDAILQAGSQLGGTIAFNIPGEGPFRIAVQTPLPELLDAITIDATTQPGYAGRPLIEIDGSGTTDGAGLAISGDGCAVRGLSITGAAESGVSVFQATGTIIAADFIGLDPNGNVKRNRQDGVALTAASETFIGGAVASARNVISGNAEIGVHIADGSSISFVFGNRIGTDPDGEVAAPNGLDGVNVEDSPLSTVGAPFGTGGNLISGNLAVGVFVTGEHAANSLVQGNRVGTDASGSSAIPNAADGVLVQDAPDVLVGGSATSEGNLVSGNTLNGVALIGRGVAGSRVQGNVIGTDTNGTRAIENLGNGVYGESASDFLIGGAGDGEGNVISGNDSLGIGLFAGTTGARMQGNFIGTGRSGEVIGNFADGVYIQDSSDNLVGGVDDGEGNTIAHNGATGVFVYSGERNTIVRNSIHDNDWIGIDVGSPAVSAIDPGDADGGSNTGLNFPMTTMVTAGDSSTTVNGVYTGAPGMTLRLEFFASTACDPFGFGEGELFLGTSTIVTDEAGKAIFTATLPVAAPVGSFVSSTATDERGNTSEFSECALVTLSWDPPAVDGGPPVNLSIGWATGRVTLDAAAPNRRADVTAYKIYRSSTSPVATTPGNLFTSVPASQTSSMAPASAGGFFAVTACYSDGSESGPSNDSNSPGAPLVASVKLKGASKLVADGSNFTPGVLVIVDGLPFVMPAKLKRGATRVVQKGPLLTGQTLVQYLASRPVKPNGRREALVGFRNANGAVTGVVLSSR